MLNTLHSISTDTKLDGAITKRHAQTPAAQNMLISSDERLFITLNINGRFQKGSTTAAINEMCLSIKYYI